MADTKTYGRPDTPVNGLDDDLFNVKPYIEGLVQFIKECNTPMTISIQGDWGTGKTSMMNMIRSELGDSVVPVWFNTWQFSQFNMDDALAISMLQTLVEGLNLDEQVKRSFTRRLANLGRKAAKAGVTAAGNIIGGEGTGSALGEMFGEDGRLQDFASTVSTLRDDFENAVQESLNRDGKANRVVVFIDDLDRLQPERAVELLEVLKIFLDCESCVFVLAVDYGVVVTGIRQKFGDNIGEDKGKSFFDKIIQLPFKMPVAQYNIDNYVKDMLVGSGIPEPDDDELKRYKGLIRTSVGYNPRSMKRLFNTYQLLNIMTKNVEDIEAVNKYRILFAILCMQSRFDKLYEYFAENRDIDPDQVTELATFRKNSGEESDITDDAVDPLINVLFDDKESYRDLTPEESSELESARRFMKAFVKAIQLDDDEELSETEMKAFEDLLRFSTITSVNVDQDDYDDDRMREMRDFTIRLSRDAVARANANGASARVQTRRRKAGHWTSETLIYGRIGHGIGGDYELFVTRDPDSSNVNIAIGFWTNKRNAVDFYKAFEGDRFDYGEAEFNDEWTWFSLRDQVVQAEPENEAAEKICDMICHITKVIDDCFNETNGSK